MNEKFKIDTPDDYYASKQADFQLANDLDDGRKAMIRQREKYLPKESGEEQPAYEVRLNRTDFYPGFSECLDDLVSAVFKKDIILDESASDEFKNFCDNVDLQGNKLSVFAKSLLRNAEKYGINYFLVEYPHVPKGLSLAEERKLNARPYFKEVTRPSIIFMDSDTVNGQQMLLDVRIKEKVTAREGFGKSSVEQIRRYVQELDESGQPWRVRWEIYKKNEKGEYPEIPTKTDFLEPMKRIPLVAVYTKQDGFYRCRWRLEHCAWLNVIHWQSSSDQRNILRVVRCPILAHAGFYKDPKDKMVIGPNTHQGTTSPDGKMWYVEHSGAAIESGANDLERLKQEMRQAGMKMAIKKTGSITATEVGINTAQSQSELQADAQSLEDAIENGFVLCSEWDANRFQNPPSITANTDFGILEADSGNNSVILNACNAGKLSNKTYLTEMKRRNQLPETLDVDAELELIKLEQAVNWLGSGGEDETEE